MCQYFTTSLYCQASMERITCEMIQKEYLDWWNYRFTSVNQNHNIQIFHRIVEVVILDHRFVVSPFRWFFGSNLWFPPSTGGTSRASLLSRWSRKVTALPGTPARPVRPMRWMWSSGPRRFWLVLKRWKTSFWSWKRLQNPFDHPKSDKCL